MNIYIRISENQKSISNETRWNSYDKITIIKKCWISLLSNTDIDDSIHVFYHDVSDETLKWIEEKTKNLLKFTKIESIEDSFIIPLKCIKEDLSKETNPDTLFALLEDDYLWKPNESFKVIKETSKYWKGFISPSDTTLNYINPRFSKIYVGLDRHWRTTNYISWNIIGCNKIFSKYIDDIIDAGMDKDKLNKILQNTECINPLPGLSTHCKDKDISPLVDWDYIWKGIDA